MNNSDIGTSIGSEYTRTKWRLIITKPMTGAWNMAADQALMESLAKNNSLPILRLYAWSPPCLSLGYAQTFHDMDIKRLHQRGWDYVRRQTGGRAILHTDELTYSVIGPENEPRLRGGVLPSYRRLSTAILDALVQLGLPAEAFPSETAGANSNQQPVCFEVPSSYEITVSGKKLVGSAQARKREGVLQHGSVPLYGDITRIIDVINFKDEDQRKKARKRLLDRASTVEKILGKKISWQKAADSFVLSFEKKLNLELVSDSLADLEIQRIEELVESKYAHPSWNERI